MNPNIKLDQMLEDYTGGILVCQNSDVLVLAILRGIETTTSLKKWNTRLGFEHLPERGFGVGYGMSAGHGSEDRNPDGFGLSIGFGEGFGDGGGKSDILMKDLLEKFRRPNES